MANDRGVSSIHISGAEQTVKALKEMEPDLHKILNKNIRQALNVAKQGALGRYPRGAYSVSINNSRILGSIAPRGGGSRAASWGDSAPGIRAAIFEFAGKLQDGRSPQARGMIASLNSRYGTPGRFLWAAWDEHSSDVLGNIRASVQAQEKELQARLNAAGEAF